MTPRPATPSISLEVGVHEDPKTVKAAGKLAISCDEFVGKLTRVWLYLMQFRQSPSLDGIDADHLASVFRWKGEPAALWDVLVECGWIKSRKRANGLHFFASGWARINGPRLNAMARKQRYNARMRASQRTPKERLSDVRKDGLSSSLRSTVVEEKNTGRSARSAAKTSHRTKKTGPGHEAEELAARLVMLSGKPGSPSVARAIQRILDRGDGEEFRQAIDKADEIWTAEDTDPFFRISPFNFASGPQRWHEFPSDRRPAPARRQVAGALERFPEPIEDSEAEERAHKMPTIPSAWDDVRDRAEAEISAHSFSTWFKPTRAIATAESGAVVVLVPNRWFSEWLRQHYAKYLDGGRFLIAGPTEAVKILEGTKGGDSIGEGDDAEA